MLIMYRDISEIAGVWLQVLCSLVFTVSAVGVWLVLFSLRVPNMSFTSPSVGSG